MVTLGKVKHYYSLFNLVKFLKSDFPFKLKVFVLIFELIYSIIFLLISVIIIFKNYGRNGMELWTN